MRKESLLFRAAIAMFATWMAFSFGCTQPTSPASTPPATAATPTAAASTAESTAPASPSPTAIAKQSSPSPTAATQAQKPTILKVAHAPTSAFAPLYIAMDRGYFREEGIEVELTVVGAGQDAMAFVSTGQLDAAVVGLGSSTFNAVKRGLDIRIVSSMGLTPEKGDPSAMMVRVDLLSSGEVNKASDLKGRKIAVSGGLGSGGSYLLATLLQPANLSLKDVELVNLKFAEQAVAFQNKAIDAAIVPAPYTTEIAKGGWAQIPDFGHIAPWVGTAATVYGPNLTKTHPELGQKMMVALLKGAHDASRANYYSDGVLDFCSTLTTES